MLPAHVTCEPGPAPSPTLDLLTGSRPTSVLLFPWPSDTTVCQCLSLPSLPLHPSCLRCGSKLPFRSSTPWVWASGVSSPLPPTTRFTRTSIGQCSFLDPEGPRGEERGWPGRASWEEAGAGSPGLRPDFSRQRHLHCHSGECHHQHPGWLRHLLRAGLHVSGAGCACGPSSQSRWAGCPALVGEGVCRHSWGRASEPLCGPARLWMGMVCVCVYVCRHVCMNERISV